MDAPAPTPVPIHDILPPVGFFPYPIWVVALVALAMLAVVAVVVWFFFFRKRATRATTATERALKRLDALRDGVEQADAYPFSIEVSEVVRRYIEESQGLTATRQTTREFLDAIHTRSFYSAEEVAVLSEFLELADVIKFARVTAGVDECRSLLGSAEKLITQQRPQPAEVTGA